MRAAALGALTRMGRVTAEDLARRARRPRRPGRQQATRSASEPLAASASHVITDALVGALGDADPLVVDGACWALGERTNLTSVQPLCEVATGHRDTRCREAAVAALGAIGDPRGLSAVLGSLDDKPTVQRRAAVALAAFVGPEAAGGLDDV